MHVGASRLSATLNRNAHIIADGLRNDDSFDAFANITCELHRDANKRGMASVTYATYITASALGCMALHPENECEAVDRIQPKSHRFASGNAWNRLSATLNRSACSMAERTMQKLSKI